MISTIIVPEPTPPQALSINTLNKPFLLSHTYLHLTGKLISHFQKLALLGWEMSSLPQTPASSTNSHLYPQALQLKLYQAFIFSIPILFSIILFLLFYLFYLKRRASTLSSSPPILPRSYQDQSAATTYHVSSVSPLFFCYIFLHACMLFMFFNIYWVPIALQIAITDHLNLINYRVQMIISQSNLTWSNSFSFLFALCCLGLSCGFEGRAEREASDNFIWWRTEEKGCTVSLNYFFYHWFDFPPYWDFDTPKWNWIGLFIRDTYQCGL